MPFDALALAAVTDEARAATTGGRIQKIIQPSALSLGLAIYSGGAQVWLLASADPRFARVHVTQHRLAKAFPTPSSFVMLLRKYLEGGIVAGVEHVDGERIMIVHSGQVDRAVKLRIEIMGKHSNVILVDRTDMVLGALKVITGKQSRLRPVVPGQRILPPPPQVRDLALYPAGPRLDPYSEAATVESLLSSVPPDTHLHVALAALLKGASPFLIEQIAARAAVDADAPMRPETVGAIVSASRSLYELYRSREWQPTIFVNRKDRRDFAPYKPLNVQDMSVVTSMSEAVDDVLSHHESRDVLNSTRKPLMEQAERALRTSRRRLASLQEGLEAAQQADAVKVRGQMVLAYSHEVEPRATHLEVPDLDMSIPLDTRLSAVDNAERLFRRYRKLRDALHRLPALISEAETELARLTDLSIFLGLAASEEELRAIRSQLSAEEKGSGEHSRKRDRPAKKGPARFLLDGYTILVGRNARENEDLTFQLARRGDLWLHARERTGAHVVIQGKRGDVPDKIIEEAARLAAYFSEGRADGKVDVDVTLVRDVRRVPGGAPGRVTYRNAETLTVEPIPSLLEQSDRA